LLEKQHDLNDDGATHAAARSAATAPMVKARRNVPRLLLLDRSDSNTGEVDQQHVEHREAENDEEDRDARLNTATS